MSVPPFASVKMSLHSYKTKMHFFAQKTYIPWKITQTIASVPYNFKPNSCSLSHILQSKICIFPACFVRLNFVTQLNPQKKDWQKTKPNSNFNVKLLKHKWREPWFSGISKNYKKGTFLIKTSVFLIIFLVFSHFRLMRKFFLLCRWKAVLYFRTDKSACRGHIPAVSQRSVPVPLPGQPGLM